MALVENDFILSSDPVEAEEWQATGTRLSDYWARVVNKPHSVPTKSAPSASQSAPEEIEPEESHLPPPIDIDIDIAASHAPETRTEPPTPCISRATLALSSPTTPLPASHSPAGPSLSSHSVQPPAPQSPTLPQLQTRSFRQRKPGQLNPYSLEQLKYAHSLSKTDWQDAIVPLKRQTEASAEELTKRKEWSKLRGEDDLDGWMVLEDGVRVRKEDVQHRQAEQGHAASKHKKRKSYDVEKRLQRALQGYSSDSASDLAHTSSSSDENDDPRDIPRERSTPKRKRAPTSKKRRTTVRPQQPLQHAKAAPSSSTSHSGPPDSVIEIHSSSPVQAASKPARKKQRLSSPNEDDAPPPKRTIHLDEEDGSDESQQSEEDEEEMREMRRVNEDRFALKGRKKRFLKGMMPGVFMRKAERDLELMRKEQRSGRHVDYAGSGDEDELVQKEKKGEAKRRRAFYQEGDDGLKFDSGGEEIEDLPPRRARLEEDSADSETEFAQQSWLAAAAPRRRRQPHQASTESRRTFAPRAGAGNRQQQTRDMIDRLLVQSKAAHEAQQKRRPKVKTKKKTTHPSTVLPQKQISLADEDELLGLPVFRAPILPQNSAAHDEIPPPPVQPGTTSASTSGRPRNSDSSKNAWQSFKKFSHDFQIERLRPGSFALSPDSPLVLGQIVELIDFLQDDKVTSVRTVFPFGTPLHEDLDAEAIESLLPSLSDRIIDAASKWVNASPEEQSLHPRPAREACEVLRYLGLRTNLDTPTETLHLIQARIDHLDRRFRSIAENGTQQAALNYFLLPLHWAGLELALRLRVAAHHQKLDSSLFASPTARVQRVIKGLVQYGINSTGKALKTAQPDLSVEIWASLINLSLAAPPAPSLEVEWPTSESLWDHLISELDDRALVNSTHPVMASEALCYAAMTLCSASQISAAGNVLDQPSLFAYWPVIARSLEPITVDDMRESMDKWSSVELTRRDGYLWSLFARIMTMINRWGWVLTDSDGILSKLYDILNARQLDNLAIDAGAKDFPTFLQHFDGSVGTTLEGKDDSAFHILLKLLVHVSRNILSSADTEPDGRRALNRMLMRVTPMRKLPKDSSRAMLVNHYSLFITLAVIAPWTSNQRFSQIKTVISFDQSDKEIRPVIIRAMLYFSLVSYHQNLPLDPVLGWFGQTAQTLRQEYTDFDRKRIQLNAPARKPTKGMSIVTNHAERSRDQKLLTNQLYHCALTLTMVLRAIQNIMDVTTQGIGDQVLFPDARFLNSAWLSAIFASPVALDPLIGMEVLKCLQRFLDLRAKFMDQQKRLEASQDEFGFADFDFDDPALNDLIGFNPSTSNSSQDSREQIQSRDLELARNLKNEVSPALFKLITTIFLPNVGPQDGAPQVHRGDLKLRFVNDLVYCWASCAAVMVQHKLKTWTSYFRFGDEACSRIADTAARRKCAMLLAIAIAEIDRDAFSSLSEEIVRAWMEAVVQPTLSRQHVDLTNHILAVFGSANALFVDMGSLEEIEDNDGSVRQLLQTRPQLLEALFSNVGHILRGTQPDNLQAPQTTQLFTILGQMMTAMKEYCQSYNNTDGQSKANYISFCSHTVTALGTATGGQVNERTVPALKALNNVLYPR